MDLFNSFFSNKTPQEVYPNVYLLSAYALHLPVLSEIEQVLQQAPLRQMLTPGGRKIQVHMSACGDCGWVSDSSGYRYSKHDPHTQSTWPQMPRTFSHLAHDAAVQCNFANFRPDSCLINQYLPGMGMGSHRDENEKDLSQPVVSVSLGMSATFKIFTKNKSGGAIKIELQHGDVLVWGRTARLMYHAILPIRSNPHSQLGNKRINLTFRKAL